MDIEALQATLRTFAAERDWQPFHTPKNLSTTLIVEAADCISPREYLLNGTIDTAALPSGRRLFFTAKFQPEER